MTKNRRGMKFLHAIDVSHSAVVSIRWGTTDSCNTRIFLAEARFAHPESALIPRLEFSFVVLVVVMQTGKYFKPFNQTTEFRMDSIMILLYVQKIKSRFILLQIGSQLYMMERRLKNVELANQPKPSGLMLRSFSEPKMVQFIGLCLTST